jgi:hypothetical protein
MKQLEAAQKTPEDKQVQVTDTLQRITTFCAETRQKTSEELAQIHQVVLENKELFDCPNLSKMSEILKKCDRSMAVQLWPAFAAWRKRLLHGARKIFLTEDDVFQEFGWTEFTYNDPDYNKSLLPMLCIVFLLFDFL